MNSFSIVIPGEPIPWERVAYRQRGKKIWHYDAQKKHKDAVRWQIKSQLKEMPVECSYLHSDASYHVGFIFLLGLNDRLTEAKRNAKLWGLEDANEKPDLDNLVKFYLDCGKGLLWPDDQRITKCVSKKKYSKKPRTIIVIMSKHDKEVPSSVQKILCIVGPDKMQELAKHVQMLSFLTKKNIEENLGENQRPGRIKWLAWTALLLSRFSKDWHEYMFQIAKVKNVELEIEEQFGIDFFNLLDI